MADMTTNSGYTPAPETMKMDDKVIKKMIGEALAGVDGILGAKDNITDMFKSDDDPTRGITISTTHHHEVEVTAKVFAESGKSIPEMINAATAAITDKLQNVAGLKVNGICVEVVDTMTAEEYKNQYESSIDSTNPPMPLV